MKDSGYLTIQSEKEASRFGEAFPIGNGHMGAMVYGSVPENRILLSENTFFSGDKSTHNHQENAAEAFLRMREAASEDNYRLVHSEAEQFIGIRNDYGTNLPVGSLYIGYNRNGTIKLNRRSLNIGTGVIEAEYHALSSDGKIINLKESCFISHPSNFLSFEVVGNELFSADIRFEAGNAYGREEYSKQGITFYCKAFETMHCDKNTGVSLCGNAIIYSDGVVSADSEGIRINSAFYIRMLLRMETDFCEKAEIISTPITGGISNRPGVIPPGFDIFPKICDEILWGKLYKEHISDFGDYMKRVELFLSDGRTVHDREMFEFQYGRYLLLSSSREDSVLPAHLQGIWNDNVACNIGWTCDMHLDINTQMNYWIAQNCNLQNTIEPLFSWLNQLVIVQGRDNTKLNYGYPGWAAEIVTNAWGFAAPYWASPIAPCPTGGLWIATHLYEHYLYSGNSEFLREQCLPVIEEAVEFFLEYVFKGKDGRLTTGPSISPENSFLWEGEKYQISNGCTYERLMIWELFDEYIKGLKFYEKNGGRLTNKQRMLRERTVSFIRELSVYRVLDKGTIAEYDKNFEIPDHQHRHSSHLLGLFPFSHITPEKTPELADAAERTIEEKLNPESNFEDTGWARSMLFLYEDRLLHAQKAYYHLQSMLRNLLEPNGMIYHPPTRGAGAFDHVYELDGNTGLTMGIAEMLLQSHDGLINLLPACPKEFSCGSLKGIRARGGLVFEYSWENGTITRLVIIADNSCEVELKYNKIREKHLLNAGRNIII